MIRSLINFLNQPYPEPLRTKRSWILILGISLIVFFVLALFQPFGLYYLESKSKLLYFSGYSLVTGAALIVYLQILPLLFPKVFSEKGWKVWKHIFWLLALVLTIGVGNMLYTSRLIVQININWYSVLVFEGFTFAVAIIPILLTVSLSYIRHLKRNLKAVDDISGAINIKVKKDEEAEESVFIEGNNRNEKIAVKPSEFYYAKSEGNYLQVFYSQNGEKRQDMIRLTLNNLIDIFEKYDFIMRCHRAFVVNTKEIKSVDGNAQGLRLKLKNVEGEVLVSRNYVSKIRELA
jgi:hypothetical protein